MSTKVSTDLIDLSGNTGGLVWAKGTTAEQPASATAGEMRVDTTTNTTLVYNGTQWKTLKETAFVAPPVPTHFLVVAGGGGGAAGSNVSSSASGGGGAGGLRTSYGSTTGGGGSAESTIGISLNTAYTITVGDGGSGQTIGGTAQSSGLNSVFSSITSTGGGKAGARQGSSAADGGSGGGAAWDSPVQSAGSAVTSPVVQGYGGGLASSSGGDGGGGGGGASAVGNPGVNNTGGDGGAGLQVNIDANNYYYAGGGGGGARFYTGSGGVIGSGGIGGGGDSGTPSGGTGVSGALNTGGGGGASGKGTAGGGTGGNGGSGVVILRYPTADLPYFTTTGTLNTPSATDTVADVAYPVANLAYYKLDSNANDSGLGSGYIGQGGIFNGNSEIDTGIDLDTYDETWSISLWVKFIFNSSYRYIAGDLSASGALNGFTIDTSLTGQIRFRFRNSSTSVASIASTNTYGDGDWHHIAAVKDSLNNYLYVDGVQVGTVATVNGISHTTNIILGRVGAYNGFYNGTLDQVRIYDTALSSSNVALLYAETSATSSTLNYPTGAGGIALYEFSGNANDTGGTYNGTATNVLYAFNGTATDVTYENGRFNEAANFNGTSSVISLGTLSPLNTFGGAQTISVWVKPSSADRESIIGYRQEASPYQWNQIEKMSNNTIRFLLGNYSDSSQFVFNSVGTITLNQWNHIAITVDSTSAKIYINNGTPETQTGTPTPYSNSEPTFIGGDGTYDTDYFTGQIDQVRIFSSALAAGDVEDLYNEHLQTKFTDGSDTALKFTGGTGTIKFLDASSLIPVDYLVVAGGGAGGSAGGGGGGGVLTGSAINLFAGQNYTVTVGEGGAGFPSNSVNIASNDGESSSISSIASATGGGGGGAYYNGVTANTPGRDGGSGGGGGYKPSAGGLGVSGQGFNGAASIDNSGVPGGGGATTDYVSAGGGGAGGIGNANTTGAGAVSGDGGVGVLSSINGTAYYWGGGGGGGGQYYPGGSGGIGGGGGGGRYPSGSTGTGGAGLNPGSNGATNGVGGSGGANTGGGGGGMGISVTQSGSGGSGVVILRYPNTKTITVGAGLTATTATVGTDKVTTFTAGTGTITFS
jgi:hypothetical protein